MAGFVANAQRFDPYRNFHFRLKWGGKYVAGASKVSGLKRNTDVVEHRDGGNVATKHKSRRNAKFEPLTLERGITHDPEFDAWAFSARRDSDPAGARANIRDQRKDLLLELHDEGGQIAQVYKIRSAWVSEFITVPDLDASANAVTIESMVFQHEGIEREVRPSRTT